jgi:phage-related protein
MRQEQERIPAAFYRTASGAEPVRQWLKGFDAEDRKLIGDDIKALEFGWPRGMPLCRSIAAYKGLWELRSRLPGGRIARVLFCISGGQLVLLHGFVKKSATTPKPDLDLATRRMKEVTA